MTRRGPGTARFRPPFGADGLGFGRTLPMAAGGQQGQRGAPGEPALVIVAAAHTHDVDVVTAAGADDLEEIQLAVEPLVFFQADDQGDVLEETRRLADFFPKRGLEVVAVKIVEFQSGQGQAGTLELETVSSSRAGGFGHEWFSSAVGGGLWGSCFGPC